MAADPRWAMIPPPGPVDRAGEGGDVDEDLMGRLIRFADLTAWPAFAAFGVQEDSIDRLLATTAGLATLRLAGDEVYAHVDAAAVTLSAAVGEELTRAGVPLFDRGRHPEASRVRR